MKLKHIVAVLILLVIFVYSPVTALANPADSVMGETSVFEGDDDAFVRTDEQFCSLVSLNVDGQSFSIAVSIVSGDETRTETFSGSVATHAFDNGQSYIMSTADVNGELCSLKRMLINEGDGSLNIVLKIHPENLLYSIDFSGGDVERIAGSD